MEKAKIKVKVFGVIILLYAIYILSVFGSEFIYNLTELPSKSLNFQEIWKNMLSDFFSLLFAIGLVIVSIGVLKLKQWARKGIIIYSLFATLFISVDIIRDYFIPRVEGMNIFPVWFNVVFILLFFSPAFYFTRPKVKEQFK